MKHETSSITVRHRYRSARKKFGLVSKLAREFQVSRGTIYNVLDGTTWRR